MDCGSRSWRSIAASRIVAAVIVAVAAGQKWALRTTLGDRVMYGVGDDPVAGYCGAFGGAARVKHELVAVGAQGFGR